MKPQTMNPALPDYQVRVSPRARHARLRISATEGLVVVVPHGFDQRRIPEILAARRTWWQKHLDRLQVQRRHIDQGGVSLPCAIALEAIGEQWSVSYPTEPGVRRGTYEGTQNRLTVKGYADDPDQCRAALRHWLARKAYRHFAPWLKQISDETGLPYQRLIIRGQKTRWGSCSQRKTISLNYKLLFFPPHLVRYVFVHELCHTRVMNHSPRFWRNVEALEPRYQSHHGQMREAWRFVPPWVTAP